MGFCLRVMAVGVVICLFSQGSAEGQLRADEVWVVGADPFLHISDDALFRVHSALRLPDGRIAVTDQGSREVRIYDSTGRLLATSGGEGQGPGELQTMAGMALVADTVLVYDAGLARLNEFSGDGEWLRSIPISGGQNLALVGVVDTVLVFRPRGGQRFDLNTSGVSWHTDPHRAFTRDGTVIGEFGDPSGMHYSTREGMPIIPHFARRTLAAAGEGRFYAGDAGRYEVRSYDDRGAQQNVIQLPLQPERVTEADIEHYTGSLHEAIRDSAIRRRATDGAALTPALPTKPAYRQLLVDALGRLWVEDWRVVWDAVGNWRTRWEESPERWRVFAPDGEWLASVEMPEGFELTDAGDHYVLGIWRDGLGVESIRLYGLAREGY